MHGLLQKLLGYAAPQYAHHRLLTDATGRRFAKRDRDMTIRAMRESGMSAEATAGTSPGGDHGFRAQPRGAQIMSQRTSACAWRALAAPPAEA